MVRTQISLTNEEYVAAKREARRPRTSRWSTPLGWIDCAMGARTTTCCSSTHGAHLRVLHAVGGRIRVCCHT
jgi:hypothetical protein